MKQYDQYTLSHDEFLKYNNKQQLLGNGGFGKVYKILDDKNCVYAMKIIDIKEVTNRYMLESPMVARTKSNSPCNVVKYNNNELRKHILNSLLNEVKIMRELKHPNIVSIFHYYIDKNNEGTNYYNNNPHNNGMMTPLRNTLMSQYLYIIMEYSPYGSLLKYIRLQQHKSLPELVTAGITFNILNALVYLANLSIVHGDIKAANILIFPNGVIKICDFGLSFQWDDENSDDYNEDIQDDNKRLQKIATNGSAYWLAPEIILHRMATPKSDIWSLGATIIEMLTGHPPFSNKGPLSACHAVGSGTKIQYPNGISKYCEGFLNECFQYNPILRPRAKSLIEHPWIKHSNKNIMKYVELENEENEIDVDENSFEDIISRSKTNSNNNNNNNNNGRRKKLLESFKEEENDYKFNENDFEISKLGITNTENNHQNNTENLSWKVRNLNELGLNELRNMEVIDDEIYLKELKHNYISIIIDLLQSTETDRIPRAEELLRIGKGYLRMHSDELQRFCLSGCLVPLSIAKAEHRLHVETIQLIQMLVIGAFKTRGEEWLAVSGFKKFSR